jgi:hypothetical protein
MHTTIRAWKHKEDLLYMIGPHEVSMGRDVWYTEDVPKRHRDGKRQYAKASMSVLKSGTLYMYALLYNHEH